MKRRIFFCVLLVGLLLCGCSATELENRCFPMLAAIDETDGQITFFYRFPALSQKENTDLKEASVNANPVAGETLRDCMQAYGQQLEKLADCSHMKVLVLGKRLIDDPEKYGETLRYLKETECFPRNTYVCAADDPAALCAVEGELSSDIGSYLEQFLQNHESDRQIALENLGRLLDEQENHKLSLRIPYLQLRGGAIVWDENAAVPK